MENLVALYLQIDQLYLVTGLTNRLGDQLQA